MKPFCPKFYYIIFVYLFTIYIYFSRKLPYSVWINYISVPIFYRWIREYE